MVAKSLAIGIICAVLALGSQAQLIEVTGNAAPSNTDDDFGEGISIVGPVNPEKPGASIDELTSQIFGGGDNGDDGGISIVGPVNPGNPGTSIPQPNQPQTPGNKVTEDPWQAFYDPNNKNIFGQTFPRPEEVDNESSGNLVSTVEPRQPTNQFPAFETTADPNMLYVPPGPTTQKPTTTTKKHFGLGLGGGLGGIFGWGKHTTQKPDTDGKNKGHGGIFGGLKDVLENNKDAVHKAAESVKEAGEKVAQAGKDVIVAGLKIKGSLIPDFLGGRPKN